MNAFYHLILVLLPLVSAQNATTPVLHTTDETKAVVSDEVTFTEVIQGGTSNNANVPVPHIADLNETSANTVTSDLITGSPNSEHLSHKATADPILNTAVTSSPQLNSSSQIAESRAFSLEPDDLEFANGGDEGPSTSSLRPEELSTKPHKIKKKVLVSRPKSSTEKIILTTDQWDSPSEGKITEIKDLDASTESNSIQKISRQRTEGPTRGSDSQTRSFRFPEAKSSSTERYDLQLTTSSLLLSNIQKLISNNLLNVIDTTAQPVHDEVTESARRATPNRNVIRFDADDFGTTGQSDWVPLVSEKGSNEGWSPVASFSRSTVHPVSTKQESATEKEIKDSLTDASTKRPSSTSMQTIVVIDSPITQSSVLEAMPSKKTSDMELPGSASWALASSLFTRIESTTDSGKRTHSPIVQALNDTLQRKIKENVMTLSAPIATELSKSENFTKEHNQVLKNTIPDTVLLETTPAPRWLPVATTSPLPSRSPSKTDISAKLMLDKVTSNEEAYTNLASTAAFEIMKLTTAPSVEDNFATTAEEFAETETREINGGEKLVAASSESPAVNFVNVTTDNAVVKVTEPEEIPVTTFADDTPAFTTFYPTPEPEILANSTSTSAEITLSNVILPLPAKPNTTAEPIATRAESPTTTSTTSTTTTTTTTTVKPTTTEETTTLKVTEAPITEAAMILPTVSRNTPIVAENISSTVSYDSSSKIQKYITPYEPQTELTTQKLTSPIIVTTPKAIETTTTQKITSPPKIIAETTTEESTFIHTESATVFGIEGVTSQDDDRTDDENRTILSNGTEIMDELTEENVPAYLRLTVQTSEIELCHRLPELHSAILKMLSEGTNTNVSAESIVLLNLNPHLCKPVLRDARPEDVDVRLRPVNMFLMDADGGFNKNLSEAFLTLWGHAGLDFPLPILKVDFVTPIIGGEMGASVSSGVVAAIAISSVAGICLILLGVLFVVMKRRQKKFNYGQRCTPVSLDAYSLDSVSIRNSSRRKNIRASKRSYGNAAFDDPEITSHILNFAGLANFTCEKDQIYQEFSGIPQVCPRVDEYPAGVETKNRYANVIPLPETRVVLPSRGDDPLSDYINANFVRGYNNTERSYIAAQAPLESTLPDWWRMVWEQQVKVILMLTALSENGVDKCADYLPPSEVSDSIRLFGDFQVTLKKRDVKEKYIVSTIQLKNMETNLWREVSHLWYLGWPDSGVPSEPNSLIAFLIEARSQMKTSSGSPAPTLVHCSPGTGRTGTVIACDVCIREFEQNRVVDIPRCVYHLRRSRAGAVQTRDQYAFIYQVLNTYATKLTGGALENI